MITPMTITRYDVVADDILTGIFDPDAHIVAYWAVALNIRTDVAAFNDVGTSGFEDDSHFGESR